MVSTYDDDMGACVLSALELVDFTDVDTCDATGCTY